MSGIVDAEKERQTRNDARAAAVSAMLALPRRERRKISKANGGIKIPGTTKPFTHKKVNPLDFTT